MFQNIQFFYWRLKLAEIWILENLVFLVADSGKKDTWSLRTERWQTNWTVFLLRRMIIPVGHPEFANARQGFFALEFCHKVGWEVCMIPLQAIRKHDFRELEVRNIRARLCFHRLALQRRTSDEFRTYIIWAGTCPSPICSDLASVGRQRLIDVGFHFLLSVHGPAPGCGCGCAWLPPWLWLWLWVPSQDLF